MGDSWNKDHLPAAPDPLPGEPLIESPHGRALGIMCLLVLGASLLAALFGQRGGWLVLAAALAGAAYVVGLTVVQLVRRRFAAALATLVVGILAVGLSGFLGLLVHMMLTATVLID